MDVVTGTELKVRTTELPVAPDLRPDHIVYLDSPTTGSASMNASEMISDGIANRPEQTVPASFPASSKPLIPVSIASGGVRDIFNFDLNALLRRDTPFYLGPFSTPPVTDNDGHPLVPGHMYYNTVQDDFFVYSASGTWVQFNHGPPTTLTAYYYYPPVDNTIIPHNGAGTPDSLGKVLSFEIPGGQPDADLINVYLNGALQVNGVDYILHEDSGGSGDYITFPRPYCGGSCVVVQKFTKPVVAFAANAVGVVTTGWVFDGVVKTFPLKDASNTAVIPNSTVNCLISFNERIMNPFTEFTVSGSNITFAVAPRVGDHVWVVVGLPVSNGLLTALQDQIDAAQTQLDVLALRLADLQGGMAAVGASDTPVSEPGPTDMTAGPEDDTSVGP